MRKKKKAGRPKKEPTKVIRVPLKRPDFELVASNDPDIIVHDAFNGFVTGCNYVWSKYIKKITKKESRTLKRLSSTNSFS